MNEIAPYLREKFGDLGNASEVEMPNFGREQFASMLSELGARTIVEVGVERGRYSAVLCEANPHARIWSVDGWCSYDDYTSDDMIQDRNRVEASRKLALYENNTILPLLSLDAAAMFSGESFDCVYLDANHTHRAVSLDLNTWFPLVTRGGILAGHDWIDHESNPQGFQVKSAVREFVAQHHIVPLYILGRRQIRAGEVRDTVRSWMFIKPYESL